MVCIYTHGRGMVKPFFKKLPVPVPQVKTPENRASLSFHVALQPCLALASARKSSDVFGNPLCVASECLTSNHELALAKRIFVIQKSGVYTVRFPFVI